MNFSINVKLKKLLCLLLAAMMLAAMFAGCKKDDTADETEPNSPPNLNISGETTAASTTEAPTEAPVVNENMATVISQLNVRSSPSTESNVVETLDVGDQVEILRLETVAGIQWGLINSGWVCMEYMEMNVPQETTGGNIDDPDTTEPAATTPQENNTENIKGVVNVNGLNIRDAAGTNGNVVGSYYKGDVVTILEVKDGWGRTSKGWIKMEYVTTTGNTNNNNNNNNDEEDDEPQNTTGNGNTDVIARGIVTATELNIRATASTTAEVVGSLSYGDRVEILEKSGDWGRTSKGWISLNFVYQDGTTGNKTAKGIVTGNQVNIRSGPGTGYGSVGTMNAGERVDILEQFTYNGKVWGCTAKGWICLDYVYVDGTGTNVKTGTITGNGLNIRSGPGTGYGSVGTLNSGDTVKILYQITIGDTTWGNIDKGWISMAYVNLS